MCLFGYHMFPKTWKSASVSAEGLTDCPSRRLAIWADLSGGIVTAINLTNKSHPIAFSAILLILNGLDTIMLKRMRRDCHCLLMSVTAHHTVLGSFPPSALVLYHCNTADSVREAIKSCALLRCHCLHFLPSVQARVPCKLVDNWYFPLLKRGWEKPGLLTCFYKAWVGALTSLLCSKMVCDL